MLNLIVGQIISVWNEIMKTCPGNHKPGLNSDFTNDEFLTESSVFIGNFSLILFKIFCNIF